MCALNLAESASTALDAVDLVRINIAYAIELQRQRSAVADLLANVYLNKARAAAALCQGRAAAYNWVFTTEGTSLESVLLRPQAHHEPTSVVNHF